MLRNHRSRAFWIVGAVTLVALMVAPANLPGGPTGSALGAHAAAVPLFGNGPFNAANVTFTLSQTGINLSNIFWGTTISPRARLLAGEADLVNATPTQIVVYPGANAGEHYDPITDRFWKLGAEATNPPLTNESDFVSWCRSIHCAAIMQVPGEINNASFAEEVVNYTEGPVNETTGPFHFHDLNFTPAYWEIGNEPELWACWNLPWSEWNVTDCPGNDRKLATPPTPTQYALEVHNYIQAMRQSGYPVRIIGVPATGRANGPFVLGKWIYETVLINGANISAVAFHEYPVSKTPTSNLTTFYQAITPNSNVALDLRTLQTRQNISAAANASGCGCASKIQVFVTEIGSGLSHGANYLYISGFPGALDLAVQMTQAMDLNISNLDLFAAVLGTSNSWFNFTGAVRPDYTMYSQIFNHLGTEAFPVSFTTPSTPCVGNKSLCSNLYGIGTIDHAFYNRSDLMLINVNTSTSVRFNESSPLKLPGIGNVADTPLEVWTWNGTSVSGFFSPYSPSPIPTPYPDGLPANWTIGPQTVAILESYPQGGVQVRFTESGFNARESLVPRWYLNVGGVFGEANGTTNNSPVNNITFFLPPGQFNVTGVPIPLPLGGIERTYKERFEPFLAPTLDVPASDVGTNTSVNLTVHFVQQWNTSISLVPGAPPGSGVVTPTPGWWNASTPLNLTARPAFGYVFTNWVEFENHTGNVTFVNTTGIAPYTDLWVNGSVRVNASFARAYPVTFVENGLAPGTDWSVMVRTHWNDTENITHRWFNSTYNPATDTTTWNNTSISTVTPTIAYSNDTFSSMTGSLGLERANGTYAFSVPDVPGYRSLPVSANFTVAGGFLVVDVSYSPITGWPDTYPVKFVETGLPSGTNWSITVRNTTTSATGPTLAVDNLLNGSYGYVASTTDGLFRAHPPAFGFNVSGNGSVIQVGFAPVRYDVIWEETGLGNVSWSVNVSGQIIDSNGTWTTVPLTNGTYTFTIANVLDYVPQLRSGTVAVAGAVRVFAVEFIRAAFPVTFTVSGGPTNNDPWSVRLSNVTVTMADPPARFFEPNGTYTFNVTPPAGFVAVPSHGAVSVDGAPAVVMVSFALLGSPPIPPIWNLALPALGATAAIAVVAWGTFLLVGAGKRRRPGAKP